MRGTLSPRLFRVVPVVKPSIHPHANNHFFRTSLYLITPSDSDLYHYDLRFLDLTIPALTDIYSMHNTAVPHGQQPGGRHITVNMAVGQRIYSHLHRSHSLMLILSFPTVYLSPITTLALHDIPSHSSTHPLIFPFFLSMHLYAPSCLERPHTNKYSTCTVRSSRLYYQ